MRVNFTLYEYYNIARGYVTETYMCGFIAMLEKVIVWSSELNWILVS